MVVLPPPPPPPSYAHKRENEEEKHTRTKTPGQRTWDSCQVTPSHTRPSSKFSPGAASGVIHSLLDADDASAGARGDASDPPCSRGAPWSAVETPKVGAGRAWEGVVGRGRGGEAHRCMGWGERSFKKHCGISSQGERRRTPRRVDTPSPSPLPRISPYPASSTPAPPLMTSW